ncbi:MAG: bifunctional hydroxymethylpyrimidine kinase/phosphomethylpyrimidine kinase [Myxococcota bacterium]
MSRPTAPPPTALSIAGSDPTGGAGLQADLQVFRHFGVHGLGVVSALTVQDSAGVRRVLPVFPSVVLDQLRVLLRDIRPGAVKIGMLGSDDVLRNVLLALHELPDEVPVVVDPVLLASDGTPLLERRAWGSLRGLFERATLVTPNLPEAEALCGLEGVSPGSTEEAARHLVELMGASAVLVKGGHRSGAPRDLLAGRDGDRLELHWLEGERVEVGPVHGTGCALSSAIAARLAFGADLRSAVETAKRFVAEGLRAAAPLGSGARFLVYA